MTSTVISTSVTTTQDLADTGDDLLVTESCHLRLCVLRLCSRRPLITPCIPGNLWHSVAYGKSGAPERSRTPNPQIRSLVLYPVELRAHQ
jgi:hypothetical protein